jgi:hypothetical protein
MEATSAMAASQFSSMIPDIERQIETKRETRTSRKKMMLTCFVAGLSAILSNIIQDLMNNEELINNMKEMFVNYRAIVNGTMCKSLAESKVK